MNGWEPFAGWGTNETIAFVTLIVTVVTLIVTVLGLGWTAINTYRSSQSAQKLLENDLRATLDIAPNLNRRRGSQGDELEFWRVQNDVDGPHVYMSGYLRNIGRYVARDIELTPFLGQRQGRADNPSPQPLYADHQAIQFDFSVPFSPVDPTDLNASLTTLFASGEQTRLVFTFKDGNPTAEPYEVCFTFAPGEKPETWVSTKVPCAATTSAASRPKIGKRGDRSRPVGD